MSFWFWAYEIDFFQKMSLTLRVKINSLYFLTSSILKNLNRLSNWFAIRLKIFSMNEIISFLFFKNMKNFIQMTSFIAIISYQKSSILERDSSSSKMSTCNLSPKTSIWLMNLIFEWNLCFFSRMHVSQKKIFFDFQRVFHRWIRRHLLTLIDDSDHNNWHVRFVDVIFFDNDSCH